LLLQEIKKQLVLSNEKTTVTTTSRNTHCNRLQPRALRSCSLNLLCELVCLQCGQCGGLERDSKDHRACTLKLDRGRLYQKSSCRPWEGCSLVVLRMYPEPLLSVLQTSKSQVSCANFRHTLVSVTTWWCCGCSGSFDTRWKGLSAP
jgi:hypothetical protein